MTSNVDYSTSKQIDSFKKLQIFDEEFEWKKFKQTMKWDKFRSKNSLWMKYRKEKNNQITVSTDCSIIWWLKIQDKCVFSSWKNKCGRTKYPAHICLYVKTILWKRNFDFLRLCAWRYSLLEIAHQPPSPKLFCTWCSCTHITQ